jgi:hypothetical protein
MRDNGCVNTCSIEFTLSSYSEEAQFKGKLRDSGKRNRRGEILWNCDYFVDGNCTVYGMSERPQVCIEFGPDCIEPGCEYKERSKVNG